MKRLFILFVSLLIANSSFLAALDFGMVINGELEAAAAPDEQGGNKTDALGTIILAPWLSLPLGGAELYFSAGLNVNISDNSVIAPELFRLEFSHKPSDLFSYRAGRFSWQDPSGFTANGRFDGAELFFNLGKIRLGASALYTGLLFKDTAEVNPGPFDAKDYTAGFKWQDFGNTYFAPRRLITAVYGQFPGFPSGRGRLYAGLLAQFDLSDAGERFHTQYLLLRHTLVIKDFDIAAAGAAELENTKAKGIRPAFAFTLEGGWQVPGSLQDRLSAGLSWASGAGSTAAFFPIIREARSYVLKPALSGIMIINANYNALLLPALSAELGCSYFIRTDSTSFTAPYLEDSSYPLGLELDTGLLWVPFSDLSVQANGGIFLPQTGTAWAKGAPVLWRITIGTIFSF